MPSIFAKTGGPRFPNLWSHVAVEQITWQPVRRTVNRWRRKLGLEPLPIAGLYRSIYQSMPLLYGFSTAVVPPPGDWPQQVKVTGYWVREMSADWQPAENIVQFLESGPVPIYVGFGSRPERRPEALAETVLAAVRRAGRRAVLLTGWGGLRTTDSSDDVLVVEQVPHHWLFPQMAAIVHHGGAGTTGTALQSGTPSIVVPSFADQFFWGERVEALGVGVNLPRRDVAVASLATAIEATSEPELVDRASELGARLRSENGVRRAVAELNTILNT